MKYLSIILIALCLCFTACNNNDEPIPNGNVTIIESYLPGTIIFEESDMEFRNKIKGWNNEKRIVNSASELPNDPLGFTEAYSKINFNEYTLLIYYNVHTYDIISYRCNVIKNNSEDLYDWNIILGVSGDLNYNDQIERLAFTRYAVLVRKIPVNESNLRILFSVTSHN